MDYTLLILIISMLSIMLFLIYIVLKQRKAMNYDYLTNLISYSSFLKKGELLLEKAKPREYTLALVDIDDFKNLNHLLGVETANTILSMSSSYLKSIMKELEITDYLLTRKSADQFLFLYKTSNAVKRDTYSSEYGKKFSQMVKDKLNTNIELRYSIGKVAIDDPNKSLLILIGEAHIANEQCKNYYNAHVETFNPNMVNQVEKNILYAINQHLLENSLEIYLQPKYDLNSSQIVGAEALVRWIEDGQVIYTPDQFIPIFEKYNFIPELDLFMFEQVCKTQMELGEKSVENILISVNMSRITLMQPNIVKILLEILKCYGVSPNEIEIEITESALCVEIEKIAQQVRELKTVGFQLSLDDFGAGQASLANLNSLKIDTIKLDKDFVTDFLNKSDMRNMIQHLIHLLHKFDLKVVAEGVETKEDVEVLKEFGCDIVQGYYFSKPVPRDMFYRLI
ncbi:GGDEF domain-containing phosphodiesterase [Oscillospiraceae bacterium PP1C4]